MFRISAVLSLIAALALISTACATSQQEEPPPPAPVAEPAPPPPPPPPPPAAPAPEPEPVAEPVRMLPETASSLPLLGLAGLSALGLGGLVHGIRRWML